MDLKETGIVTTSLIEEMNRPVRERIRQMLINMERIRWVPAEPTTDFFGKYSRIPPSCMKRVSTNGYECSYRFCGE